MGSNEAENDEHAWFSEQIGAYLSGGLDAAERRRFEAHTQTCSECAGELDWMREMEGKMSEAFAGTIPAADFESRLVTRLRLSGRNRLIQIHPWARKAAVAAAAVAVI
ncbi:MAG TPA: zf-HC2 domain-containing protein, partial [Tepidisphaeraceae bacterium]